MKSEVEYQLPQRDPQIIQKMFDAISFRYDLLNFLMSFGLDANWRKKVVLEATPQKKESLLDLACGTGDIAFTFLKHQPEMDVVGLDFSPQMIEKAKVKARKKKHTQAIFKVGDALKLDLENQSVDIITMSFALRNLADLPKAFQEMARVLRPGGRVLCLELTRPKNILLKWGHFLFLKTYVPIVGFLFSGDYKAYAYLAKSIREFPPAETILRTMTHNGLENTRAVTLSGGIATIFIGEITKQ